MAAPKQSSTSPASRKPGAEALLKHYEQMIGLAGDIIYSTDADGCFVQITPSIEKVLGYLVQELLGKHFTELVHPDWRKQVTRFYQNQLTKGTPETKLEFPTLTRGGETRWVEQVTTLAHEDSTAGGFHAYMRDVSHYKQVEEQLKETVDRFSVIGENANVALFVAHKTTLLYANEALAKLLNCGSDLLVNIDLLDWIHPDNRQQVKSLLNDTHKQNDHLSVQHEIRIVRQNGEERWVELTLNDILFRNNPALVGICSDITDRKASDADLKENITRLEVIQRVDTALTENLKFEYVLKMALEAAVNLTAAEAGAIHLVDGDSMWVAQVIGNFPSSMIGSHVTIDRGIVGRVFQNQRAELVSDVTIDPDYIQNVIETQAQMTLPLVVNERLIGVLNVQTIDPNRFTPQMFDFMKVLVARIASALENARLYHISQTQLGELQNLYQQVSNLEQMKTQMIRVAAHDLRNPLGVISGYLQMLNLDLKEHLTERSNEHFTIIQQSIERIDKITRDILTLEKVNASQDLPDERVDMTEIVKASCEEFRIQAVEKHIDYHLEIDPKGTNVQGDRILLRESVGNLISNAIKYTPENGQVAVHLKSNKEQVIFEVSDTGYGIPAEQQANLFKAFYRVNLKETRSIKGTGLGLHLVKSIIERHRGEMHFRSDYGKGSTFGFELPCAGHNGLKTRAMKHQARIAADHATRK